jgi:hypothetical protein
MSNFSIEGWSTRDPDNLHFQQSEHQITLHPRYSDNAAIMKPLIGGLLEPSYLRCLLVIHLSSQMILQLLVRKSFTGGRLLISHLKQTYHQLQLISLRDCFVMLIIDWDLMVSMKSKSIHSLKVLIGRI